MVEADVIHKLFGNNQLSSSNSELVDVIEAPASKANLGDIWKTCKEASRNHNPSLLLKAFERYININVNSLYYTDDVKPYATSLLHYAVERNDIDVVKLLLSMNNIDVNKTNVDGETALMLAASDSHISVVDLLLNVYNIDVNKTDNEGVTALMLAASGNHIGVVRELLNMNNINVNKTDVYGDTALMLATFGGNNEIVKLLKKPT